MGQVSNPNPGVQRDNLPQRNNKGNSYDNFDFTANNQFGIPASKNVYGWQSKSFDCIGTPFKVDEEGKLSLRMHRPDNKDLEHSVARELAKGTFCTDALVLEGYDAYNNPREFLIHIENNFIKTVIEDDAIIYMRPEPTPSVFKRLIDKLFS